MISGLREGLTRGTKRLNMMNSFQLETSDTTVPRVGELVRSKSSQLRALLLSKEVGLRQPTDLRPPDLYSSIEFTAELKV